MDNPQTSKQSTAVSLLNLFLLIGGVILSAVALRWLYEFLGVGGRLLAIVTVFGLTLLALPIFHLMSKVSDYSLFKNLKDWKNVRPPAAGSPDTSVIAAASNAIRQNSSLVQWDNALPAIDALCDLYLSTTDETREEIRAAFPDASDNLLTYTRLSALKLEQLLEQPERDLIFRRGVAAAIIEDLRKEWRDSTVALGQLYRAATKQSLEPGKILEEMAAIASVVSIRPEIGDHPSMRTFLLDMVKNAPRQF